jgi:hypothetical protein
MSEAFITLSVTDRTQSQYKKQLGEATTQFAPGTHSFLQLITWKKPVMIVKILFSLITITIPLKLYKVHSILKWGKPVWPGSIMG